jgi:hypothetical protein
MYTPGLIIYHHIPADRLTRKYHRRWCYWRGVSQGLSDRDSRAPGRYLLGIPSLQDRPWPSEVLQRSHDTCSSPAKRVRPLLTSWHHGISSASSTESTSSALSGITANNPETFESALSPDRQPPKS